MQNEFIIRRLKEDILPKMGHPHYNIVFDAIETLERTDLALLIMNHLMENGYVLFYMQEKFHLTNPLDESVHYKADNIEEILTMLIVQTLTDETYEENNE